MAVSRGRVGEKTLATDTLIHLCPYRSVTPDMQLVVDSSDQYNYPDGKGDAKNH